MALITALQLTDFRNLPSVDIQPSAHFNIFYGNNGAGKTSLLEAIYYFGFGRSFRTSNASSLIRENCSQFLLRSQLQTQNQGISIGIERSVDGGRRIRQNGENIKSIAQIAEQIPLQLISTDSYRFFHDGPKHRRQFINWGLFHVERSFFPIWQRLLGIIKQRNAALKSKLPKSEVLIWSKELLDLSHKIDTLRNDYINELQPILEELLSVVLNKMDFSLAYNPGWDRLIGLEDSLERSFFKDRAMGYTTVGPHRADLQLLIKNIAAKDILSQGQQKLASYALLLAQGRLLRSKTGSSPVYLIDDLPSELDPDKRLAVINVLKELDAQVFITGITEQELSQAIALDKSLLFHVEQNKVMERK